MLEGAPAAREQREPALAQAAQRTLDSVAGTGVNIESLPLCELRDRDVNADACTVVAWVGESG